VATPAKRPRQAKRPATSSSRRTSDRTARSSGAKPRDTSLREYDRKRDFAKTAEPAGRTSRSRTGKLFVVQKHRATQLHYDFRLEADGVLKSWSVPKGPSLDPKDSRLAMEVEDHPVEYGSFEGIIPAGEYGGGTVMLWDTGRYLAEQDDPAQAIRDGSITFALLGDKLKGVWNLRRWGERKWLLRKKRDEYASTKDVTTEKPRSVKSKRLLAQIARDEGGDVEKARTGDPA
jgi:bifunctional non-homologous end joining protein LigD